MLLTIVSFLLILTVLVLIHELGHFLTAKFFKVKVEEFGFGFPLTKAIFSKKIGETTYSFYPALIGGFVKLYGEDEAGGGKVSLKEQKISSKNIQRAFFARPIWQRFFIIFAGVFMNFVLATTILTYLVGTQGVATAGKNVIVAEVIKNTPAEKAGLVKGDIILSVEGKALTSPTDLISYSKTHLGKEIKLQVKTPQNEVKTILVTPRVHYPSNEGAMGIAVGANIVIVRYPWYMWPFVGLKEAFQQSWMIFTGLGQLLAQLFTKGQIPQDLAGPIGIAQISGQIVQMGMTVVLSMVALLSLNLAILNALPIPALDGGRMFFLFIELIIGRKVSPKIENYANMIGMILILILFVFISFHDIARWATGGSLLPR